MSVNITVLDDHEEEWATAIRLLNRIDRKVNVMTMNQQEGEAKLDMVLATLEELSGDMEELKNDDDMTPELAAKIDAVVAKTRGLADIVPEPEEPTPTE